MELVAKKLLMELSVRGQLQNAIQEVRQQTGSEEQHRGGDPIDGAVYFHWKEESC